MSLSQELENAIDIVELVSKYVKLKKAGTNYKGLCPFPGHSEKTPSFVVSSVKQIAYCFGCHKGGGPIKFLMDIENTDFKEAIETLAHITGKKIDGFSKKDYGETKSLYSIHKDIALFYQKELSKNPHIEEYIKKRGIAWNEVKEFFLGYAGDGIGLYNALKEKGYDDTLIEESKVFIDVSRRKDKFIGRLIFPIQNLRGEIVAFAGRIIENGEPKYLNSPTTKVYDKSSILYGLFQGKKEIFEQDSIIVCEGYMDTISLHQAGYKNTVCVSGTALTEKHIEIIKRLTHKIYLCFDNDKAGDNATRLSLEMLKNKGLEVKIIVLEGAKDPDEIIKKGDDFGQYIKKAESPIGYFLKKGSDDIVSLDDKKKNLKEMLDILKTYSDNIEKDDFIKEISQKLDINIKIVYDEFNKLKYSSGKNEVLEKKDFFTSEDYLIAYSLTSKKYISLIKENILFQDIITTLEKDENVFLEQYDLERKEKIRGLSLQIEEENNLNSEEKILEGVKKHCEKYNSDMFKKQIQEYKENLSKDPNNIDLLQKYSLLLKKAKEKGIK